MKAIGFMVCSQDWGDPLTLVTRSSSLWESIPAGGILLRGDHTATAFATRRAARDAIVRTKQHFLEREREEPFRGFEIRRLMPVGYATS